MLWLDSTLGLAARRLAYTQVALENPGYLAELFVPRLVRPGEARGFRARFAGTAVKRIGRNRFLRNVLIAIGNVPQPSRELVAAARRALDDPSPLVRGAAVWAFGRIAGADDLAAEAAARFEHESDAAVTMEWQLLAPISAALIPAEPPT